MKKVLKLLKRADSIRYCCWENINMLPMAAINSVMNQVYMGTEDRVINQIAPPYGLEIQIRMRLAK